MNKNTLADALRFLSRLIHLQTWRHRDLTVTSLQIHILQNLRANAPRDQRSLSRLLGVSDATTSDALRVMQIKGVIDRRKSGKSNIVTITDDGRALLLKIIRRADPLQEALDRLSVEDQVTFHRITCALLADLENSEKEAA